MSTEFTIRRCTPRDAAAVAALGARLFRQAYEPTYPEPELTPYLARCFNEPLFARELADPNVRVLVAESREGSMAAYAHVRATVGERPDGVTAAHPIEVVRFYVDAPWHGAGLAHTLMAACVAEARAMGGEVLWLSVLQEAQRPQAFYRRAGFTVVGTATFLFGDRRDADFVMARPLLPTVMS